MSPAAAASRRSTAPLESLYEKYKDQGFVVVGFPANNFGAQEPGTNQEIKTFCSRKYNVTFPMYGKVSVKGDDQTPLYQYLTQQTGPAIAGDIKWNFTKFLVDRNGKRGAALRIRGHSRLQRSGLRGGEAVEPEIDNPGCDNCAGVTTMSKPILST